MLLRCSMIPPGSQCLKLVISKSCSGVRGKPHYGYPGLCYGTMVSAKDKSKYLTGIPNDHQQIVSRVFEQAVMAAENCEVYHTDFLTPPVLDDALSVVKKIGVVDAVVSGGYPQAERCRISIGPTGFAKDQIVPEGYPGAVAALRSLHRHMNRLNSNSFNTTILIGLSLIFSIFGKFLHNSVSHGDFLGAIMGSGVSREKLGDIIVQDEVGAQLLLIPELVEYLSTSLQQVGSVPVTCSPIPLTELQVKSPRVDVIKCVEASLRVDALASAGFRTSRSKIADTIRKGDVKVNWKPVLKSSVELKSGDIVSIQGKGRLQVGEITSTKKGKFAIELKRFL